MNDEMYGEVKLVTPGEAANILQTKNTKNRPVNQATVDYYAYQMESGLWMLNGEGIQFSKEGELLNGQHRLGGVVKSGCAVNLFFVYNVDQNAFATYDLQRTRTAADLFNLEGIRNANNKAALITKYMVLTKQEGDSKSSLKKKKITKYEILMEYIYHRELYDTIYEKTEKCYFKRNYLTTSEYGAYMAYLIKERKHDYKVVFSFFMQLAELEPCKSEIINHLRDKLYRDKTTFRKMVHSEKYAYVVKAWNAFITNKEIKVLYFDPIKEKAPIFQ